MNSLIQGESFVDPSRGGLFNPAVGPTAVGGPAGVKSTSLGNNTKLSATPVLTGLEHIPSKHVLRSVASSVLGRNHRVSTCQKVPSYGVQQGLKTRGISKNAEGKAFFHGVGACGDVHCCPVCSYKISESRRQEVLTALRSHRESGRIALLATFTFPHSRTDSLEDNLIKFRKARSKLVASRKFKDLKKLLGMSGYIRRLEVTWGESNGWHPHDHEIWFIDKADITQRQIKGVMQHVYLLWAKCCTDMGLEAPSYSRGFDLRYNNQQGGDAVGAYLTKWGHELTYGHTKLTRGDKRHTPFSILAQLNETGYDPYFYKLFRDYAKAFKGRAQLYWSRGLKDQFGINDISDDELSDSPEPIHHCEITKDQHTAISILNLFSDVLSFAERNSPERTVLYLNKAIELKDKYLFRAIYNDDNWQKLRKQLGRHIEYELQ